MQEVVMLAEYFKSIELPAMEALLLCVKDVFDNSLINCLLVKIKCGRQDNLSGKINVYTLLSEVLDDRIYRRTKQ